MNLHVISPYQTTAEAFFDQLKAWHVDEVVDIRLHNTTQLDGFSKYPDIAYFCKQILGAGYAHDTDFSPAPDPMKEYVHGNMTWEQFSSDYRALMEKHHAAQLFLERYGSFANVAVIGAATKQRRSHSEVLAQLVQTAQSR